MDNVFKLPQRLAGESDRDYHIRSAPARLVDNQSWKDAHMKKNRSRVDKRMSLKEAVREFVQDGDILSDSGFTWVRGSLQAQFEMIRQDKQKLSFMGAPMATAGFLTWNNQVQYLHNSYTGAEMRGTDKCFSRAIKEKKAEVVSEWSHGAQAVGFKAAQMGLPYAASKIMLGSDMLKYNPYVKVVNNEVTGQEDPVCLIPALYPDIVFIHVQQADKFGNARIWGPIVNDTALAVASRKVVITCEEIVTENEIRSNTADNQIPFLYVDAVVEMPYGNMPGSCPGYYYWHREWWELMVRIGTARDETFKRFLDYWVYDCRDHFDFIDRLGGGIRETAFLRKLCRGAEDFQEIDRADYSYKEVSKDHPTWHYPWEGSYDEELQRATENLQRLKELEDFFAQKEGGK